MDNQATVNNKPPKVISGKFSGERLESRVLEEQIQEAMKSLPEIPETVGS